MAASVQNYFVGKGIVSFKKTGEDSYRDLGNVPEFTLNPTIEELEHFSAREGIKTVDRTVVLSRSAEVRMVMEEVTLENLELALLGEADESTPWRMEIFATDAIEGALRLVGSNEVGRAFQVDLPSVTFLPGAEIPFITEEFGKIEVRGKCATVDGSFGTVTDLEMASSGSG